MTNAANEVFERQIEALLSETTGSIVDSLLALPDEQKFAAESGAFGRVVHGRLEARIAERMRRSIGDEDER